MELKVKFIFVKDYLDILIKEKYITKEDIKKPIHTIEELQDFLDSINLDMWSYAIGDYSEIKDIDNTVLVTNDSVITVNETERL